MQLCSRAVMIWVSKQTFNGQFHFKCCFILLQKELNISHLKGHLSQRGGIERWKRGFHVPHGDIHHSPHRGSAASLVYMQYCTIYPTTCSAVIGVLKHVRICQAAESSYLLFLIECRCILSCACHITVYLQATMQMAYQSKSLCYKTQITWLPIFVCTHKVSSQNVEIFCISNRTTVYVKLCS